MTALNIISTAATALLCAFAAFAKPERGVSKRLSSSRGLGALADRFHCAILLLILALAVFTRFYKLTEIPFGVNIDEAGAAYDAWCIANYGVDRWLYRLPVYFINHSRGQSAIYVYMTALNYKLFGGFSMFAVRFFNAFLGAVTPLAAYGLFRTVYGKRAGLFGAFAATVAPVFFMIYRFGIDAYPLLAFFAISLLCLCLAVKRGGAWLFALAGASFGLTLYTYALSYITIPLFLLLALLALARCRRISVKQALFCAVPAVLLGAPLVVELLVNSGVIPEIRSFVSFPKLPAYAGSDVSLASIPQTFLQTWRLFFCDAIPHSAVAPYYTLYLMSLPLAATGLIVNIKKAARALKSREFDFSLIAVSAFAASYLAGLLVSGFNIMRMISVFAPLLWFIVSGARFVWRRLGDALGAVIALYCACACAFFGYYFTRYNDENAPLIYFDAGAVELYRDIRERYPDDGLYYLVYRAGATYSDSYIYALLGSLESPYDFNAARVEVEEGFSSGLDNFYVPVRDFGAGELVYEVYDDSCYVIYEPNLGETMQSVVERLDESALVREERYPYLVYTPEGLDG